MAPRSGPVIGIDLGRAHSRGAYRDPSLDDHIVVFAAVPLSAAFGHGPNTPAPLVGNAAKDQADHDLKNTNDGPVAIFAPEEMALTLGKIKETAAAHLGKTVTRAAITVPAYFNDDQRQATKDAAGLAGLHCERILNEPTAAAIAYRLNETRADSFFVVCHVGAGTFDVSVLATEDGIFEILATSGKELREENLSVRDCCETLPRESLEELDSTSCKSILGHVAGILNDARVSKSQISDFLIYGRSVHIPQVVQLLERFFDNKQALSGIDPEEVVARGAAIQANVFEVGLSTVEILCCHVVVLTVGIETPGGIMAPILQRNYVLPARKSAVFTTSTDDQLSFVVRVFEGERVLTQHNQFLGEFELTGLSPGPRGKQIEVAVEMDEDGTTKVTATEKDTGRDASFTAKLYPTDSDRLERIFKEVEEFAEADAILRDALAAKALLESHGQSVTISGEQVAEVRAEVGQPSSMPV
ncbi:ATPase with role in protein import into the ER [Geranomyces michiganensis]|nr:ATPase with role in protein import into the ER [Geranomyces michiganensis]